MAKFARVRKHPIHPMLVSFPIALWVFSFAADLIYFNTGTPAWRDMALYSMIAGIIGAVIAAIPGSIDLMAMKKAEPRTVAIAHMLINVTVIIVYIANAYWRLTTWRDATGPVWLSFFALLGVGLSAWLGHHLVYAFGVGVSRSALPRT